MCLFRFCCIEIGKGDDGRLGHGDEVNSLAPLEVKGLRMYREKGRFEGEVVSRAIISREIDRDR